MKKILLVFAAVILVLGLGVVGLLSVKGNHASSRDIIKDLVNRSYTRYTSDNRSGGYNGPTNR